MKKMRILSAAVLIVFMTSLYAGEKTLPVFNLKTKNIALFKNGLGFFVKEGKAEFLNGWAETFDVPNAAFGSFWIGTLDKNILLDEVVGVKEDTAKQSNAVSMIDLIKANIGKDVIVLYNTEKIQGRIKEVLNKRRISLDPRYAVPDYSQPELAVIETSEGSAVLNPQYITKLVFPKGYNTVYDSIETGKKYKVHVSSKEKTAGMIMSYLQKGISWFPGYTIDISEEKKAKITMSASVVNDAEDLENVTLYFVVGYPNFSHADTLSPMGLAQMLDELIAALQGAGGYRPGVLNNMMNQSVTLDRDASETPYRYSVQNTGEGEQLSDFFFYNKKGISLKKGERAYYPIFSQEVGYKHVYEWNIENTSGVDAAGYQNSQNRPGETDQIWHSIKLMNSTAFPWTTAPAFVVRDEKPLSEDTLKYTPKDAPVNLRLTLSTDFKAQKREFEASRQRNVELYHNNYDLVTIKGEINLRNYKNEDISLEIRKNLTGEVKEASHKGKIEKIAEGIKGVNFNSVISWEIPLKAGKDAAVTYEYKVYVRN